MTKLDAWIKNASIVLGFIAIASFAYDYIILSGLRPVMEALQPLDAAQDASLFAVGVGLLLLLGYFLVSLLRQARYLARLRQLTLGSFALVAGGVLALLFVFSDVALLSDISKQHRFGLPQPEWTLLVPLMAFQLLVSAVFLWQHLVGFAPQQQETLVARDSNIYLIVNYVGVICGLMGLATASLGFFFPHAWNVVTHTVLGSLALLLPYGLALGFWVLTKLQEEPRQWYDEKQTQDVGKSAFATLIAASLFLVALFAANYNDLGGAVSVLWLPLYLFAALSIFSLGNLYLGAREG